MCAECWMLLRTLQQIQNDSIERREWKKRKSVRKQLMLSSSVAFRCLPRLDELCHPSCVSCAFRASRIKFFDRVLSERLAISCSDFFFRFFFRSQNSSLSTELSEYWRRRYIWARFVLARNLCVKLNGSFPRRPCPYFRKFAKRKNENSFATKRRPSKLKIIMGSGMLNVQCGLSVMCCRSYC